MNCILEDKCKQPAKPLENGKKNMENGEHKFLLYTKSNTAHIFVKERMKLMFKVSYSLKIH
jgi:hypothetical protein